MNTRSVGSRKEETAAGYIQKQGGSIIERNFRSRMGEIDIVARDHGAICFVEGKYRRSTAKGHPTEAVGIKKQLTICRTADYYRMKHRLSENLSYRFDVIAITGEEIIWYKNAFQYIPPQ